MALEFPFHGFHVKQKTVQNGAAVVVLSRRDLSPNVVYLTKWVVILNEVKELDLKGNEALLPDFSLRSK